MIERDCSRGFVAWDGPTLLSKLASVAMNRRSSTSGLVQVIGIVVTRLGSVNTARNLETLQAPEMIMVAITSSDGGRETQRARP